MNANETTTRRINFLNGDSADYEIAYQADFDAGVAAFDPMALSMACFTPDAIYLDDRRFQAFACGWKTAAMPAR